MWFNNQNAFRHIEGISRREEGVKHSYLIIILFFHKIKFLYRSRDKIFIYYLKREIFFLKNIPSQFKQLQSRDKRKWTITNIS